MKLHRLLVVLAVVGAAALAFMVAGAAASPGTDHFKPPVFDPGTYCVDGQNAVPDNPFEEHFLKDAAEAGGYYTYQQKEWGWGGWHWVDKTSIDDPGEHWFIQNVVFHPVTEGACWRPTAAPIPQPPDRYGFCSVTGNTNADGSPLAPGTFLNLLYEQTTTDDHYTGATPAFWVEGVGITCDLTPAQAAIAATSTDKVNHVGKPNTEDGPLFYVFIPAA